MRRSSSRGAPVERPASARRHADGSATRPPRARRLLLILLGASFAVPILILFTLIALNVRLGQGYFAYRYSPIRDLRTPRAIPAIAIGALACGAIWLLSQERTRRIGIALFVLALCGWGAWSFWAPPKPLTQQMFNLTSLSSDGAFVIEAGKFQLLRRYLRDFPEVLRMPVERMGGTRVLSNPPGMTIFAHAIAGIPLGRHALERYLVEQEGLEREGMRGTVEALRVAIALCAVWAASGLMAFALGRLFLSPAGAAVFAIIVTFNPCAVDFVPGKDPAQLLTINAMLWAWFAARQKRSLALAALAGGTFVIGSTFSLVHIWVAAIALAANIWTDRTFPLYHTLAAVAGAVAMIVVSYLALDWNIPLTLLGVQRRWSELQGTFDMSRAAWYAIGLPIFLLFLSPALWAMLALSIRRRRINLGTRLVICTAAVMVIIYFALGVTYELPRLWVAFLPPLVLGLAIDRPLLRGSAVRFRPRVAQAMMLIVMIQVVFTAIHWTMFDSRETEYRLISHRYYQ